MCIYIPDNKQYFEQFHNSVNLKNVEALFPTVRDYYWDVLLETLCSPLGHARYNLESYYYKEGDSLESRINRIKHISLDQFKHILECFFTFTPIRVISESNQRI